VSAIALDRCIWCVRTHDESPPSKAEHIIGSALGYPRDASGQAFALRSGEVCTDCNNNRLARLDRVLGDKFDLPRMVAGVGDDLKLLRSRWNARAMRDETGRLHLAVNNGPGLFDFEVFGTIPPPRGDGRDVYFDRAANTVEVALGGSPLFSHAVHKMAFEIFTVIAGWEAALSPRLDAVRGFVMHDDGVREVIVASPPAGEEHPYEHRIADNMVLHADDGSVRVAFLACGVFFFVDLSEDQRALDEVKRNIREQRGDENWHWFPNTAGRAFRARFSIHATT